jgi:7,8-dihydro-6-hydroxymethylpterin-pyrophosphokinase
MRQRRFVLAPLHDLAPGLEIPPDGTTVQTLLGRLGNDQSVTKLG